MSYQAQCIEILDMRFAAQVSVQEFSQWLAQIEQRFNQHQPFVLVMQTAKDTTFPEEYRKIQSVWYKANKALFYQYCIGLVRIAQDQQDLERLDTPNLHAAWGVPYFVTLQHSDALQWALQRWICKI